MLASDAHLVEGRESGEAGWSIHGDPTEGALVVAAAKPGLDKRELDERFPRVGEIPFTSESKRMTTLAVVVYLPAAHDLFGTYSLPFGDWLRVNVLAATIVPVLELAKWMERRGWFGRMD